ncbi:MAG: DUF4965 domain-containing protein, partial [Bacillota bacterium]|nr:DUF4965 domain-containing protein [Bacillota bacterium]
GLLPAMPQIGLTVTATRSIYCFAAAGIVLTVQFMAPLLPHDLDLASRPVNYLAVSAASRDGKSHTVEVYIDITGSLCSDYLDKAEITGQTGLLAGLPDASLTNSASDNQPLASSGDNQRINWGVVHLVSLDHEAQTCVASNLLRLVFAETGSLDPANIASIRHRPGQESPFVAAVSTRLVISPESGTAETVFLLAYDDGVSIDYFGRQTPAYCFRNGASFETIVRQAAADYTDLSGRCQAFDDQLQAESVQAGGTAYAALTSLAFRQAFAAHKLIADEQGDVVFLSKECFSNGCIGTVDVSYPSIPIFLLYNPELVRGLLRPIFRFASLDVWPFDFAPHDVGQYPLATGQVYGCREGRYDLKYQMPVEECGNMLIMTAAVCRADGNYTIATENMDQLDRWASYLLQYGQDPGEQLCTDDFAGHLAHNANLAVKAIVGLGAYAQILEHCDDKDKAAQIRAAAAKMAAIWDKDADCGDHTALTFDRPETWSMKYNLLFDRLLQLDLFRLDLYARDIDYWISRQNRYGLPLDSRASYTKTDWLVWCAALTDDKARIRALLEPVYRYYHETGSRVPMTDWYDTVTGRAIHFRNRTVIGGIFALLLKDRWLLPAALAGSGRC